MITAINFDYQSVVTTQEIHDVIANNMLPKKLMTQVSKPNLFPKYAFRKRHVLSVLSSKSTQNQVPVRISGFIFHTIIGSIHIAPSL